MKSRNQILKYGNGNGAPRLMTTAEAARFLGVSEALLKVCRLQAWREGPPWIRVSARSIRYSMDDLERYIEARRESA